MFKIGDIIEKENYTEAANWCNANPDAQLTIAKVGDQYQIASSVIEPTEEEKAEAKRADRDALLANTDKYMIADYPIADELREKYKAYRTYLRDLPASELFPNIDVLVFEQWHK